MDAYHALQNLLADPAVLQEVVGREVPMLGVDWGAKNEDALIHTLGINLLAAIGRVSGFLSLVEFPLPRAERWEKKLVRVDSVWFDPSSRQPILLAEFEHYSLDTVLHKLTNLYVAAHGCDKPPQVLLLCVWALDGEAVDARWYAPGRAMSVPGGPAVERPDGCQVLVVQAVFGRRREHLHLLRLRRLA